MNKNNDFRKSMLLLLLCSIFMITFTAQLNAQCTNVTMSLSRVNATCASNGTITVTLLGSDVGNIRQSDMEFKVDGPVTRSWANYSSNTITNLPAGTYTISLRAFCNSISDWVVFSNTASITLTSSYTEMDAYVAVVRRTLSCKATGAIPITIKPSTGSAPFTITMTSNPGSYTGTKTFTLTRSNASYTATQEITDLPAGSYTFTITDACSYTQTLTTTLETRPEDYTTYMFSTYTYAAKTYSQDCKTIGIYKQYMSHYTTEDAHYYYSYAHQYYEVGFRVNNVGDTIWVPSDSLSMSTFNVTLPQTISNYRGTTVANSAKLTPYLRIKGTNCVFQLPDVSFYPYIYMNMTYKDIGCNDETVTFIPYTNLQGVFCYPYRWRVVKTSDNSVIKDWSSHVYNGDRQEALHVPYGCRLEFEDSDGHSWTETLHTAPAAMTYTSGNTPCESYGMTADTFHVYYGLYLYEVDSMPVGTNIQFVSGPKTPTHTNVTFTEKQARFYPFSSDHKNYEFTYMPPGYYVFNYTLPGSGCTTRSITLSVTSTYIKSHFDYDKEESCGGLSVIPTAGQLAYKYYNGTTANRNTYYYLYTTSPYVNTDRGPVGLGDTLFFPTSSRYIWGMTYYQTGSCLAEADTIDYVKTSFALNPNVTTAYVCEGAGSGTGFIRVAGQGGSGNYSYELYDGGVKQATSSDGTFNYGTAGDTYTIRLIDVDPDCAASYDQDVLMLDLTTASILYSSSPTNTYCSDEDSIYLKCLSLGETTYNWSGTGITAAKQNLQNPAVAISDLGVGTHTYSIVVKPEGCGLVMTRSIAIKIENCNGAQDDYYTMLINTTSDSIAVLDNDGFPSSCVSSVSPIITVGPTKGTYTLTNKKIVYKPNTDFTGKDSLTYSTNCGGTVTTAKVYITIIELPDNIVDADCYITPPAQEWSINLHKSYQSMRAQQPILVGDLDGDGYPDLFAQSGWTQATGRAHSFTILKGPNFNSADAIVKPTIKISTSSQAIARVKWDNTADTAIIVLLCDDDLKLYAYNIDGDILWTSNTTIFNPTYSAIRNARAIGFADFNNDGYAEVYVGNQVFDAVTGMELCNGGTNNKGLVLYSNAANALFSVAANVIGDEKLELCAGNQVYEVNINSRTTPALNSMPVVKQVTPVYNSVTLHNDGATVIADFDGDGELEILVQTQANATTIGTVGYLYIWKPSTEEIMVMHQLSNAANRNVPFVGDINGDGKLEIVALTPTLMRAFAISGNSLTQLWQLSHTDTSGSTGLTLFDFNQDGIAEIVYRDETLLRIINGSLKSHITGNDTTAVYNLYSTPAYSGTTYEYAVVADVDGDGQAEIITTSSHAETASGTTTYYNYDSGDLRIYKGSASSPWAPARKVWNQYMYNVVNVNEDLTIPRYQMSPATVFAGEDGIPGTADDIRPYNNFFQQQTTLSKNGTPLWLTPDAYSDASLMTTSVSGNTVTVTVGIINQGDAVLGPPVYVSLYGNSVTAANLLATGSDNIQINPNDTGYVSVTIADITLTNPVNIIVRINDDGMDYPYQPECDDTNNVLIILNPAMNLMMKKNATLEGVPHDGTYSNPVSVLYNENIEYTITAVNANLSAGTVIIRDTLPSYLNYVSSTSSPLITTTGSSPQRVALEWTINGVASMATTSVTVNATPHQGCVSSQPMFINGAWVLVSDSIYVPTNYTYHQGACIGVATFSAGFGGQIYNSTEQALDYKTTPRTGIIIVPDEGYYFAGWSHDDYISLRNEIIKAKNGIMHYDTLAVYGNVNLHANFIPEEYPIRYHLNDSDNAKNNPSTYTIESGTTTLESPEKAGDIFVGWTGSNGDIPQPNITIGGGSTGELEFYANFLYSGQEKTTELQTEEVEDYVWAAKDELHIRTSKTGSIVKIYSVDGTLQKQQTILHAGETKIKLLQGIYIVTLNKGIGKKVRID